MRRLIEQVFVRELSNPWLDSGVDAAALPDSDWMITTDGFTVQPLEFPGGSIGSLAVHGVCNDLAVAGAEPKWLTLNAILEEGLELSVLERIIADLARAATAAGVAVVAGDTKVTPRGHGGGVYLAMTGLGQRQAELSMAHIQPGDALVVSGPVGDHGIAVMLAREQFGLHGELQSDSACVLPLARMAWAMPGLRFMRDPTRGGLATVAHEIALATGWRVNLHQAAIPVRDTVRAVCDILGYDPYYLACEGRIVAVIAANHAEELAHAWRSHPLGAHATIIGEIQPLHASQVILTTELGGQRLLPELEQDPLPRIC